MTEAASRPRISWSQLLLTAPFFESVVFDVLDRETAAAAAPLSRAAYHFGIFDGEVSNGGVGQYFFNQAFHLPSFAAAPAFIAQNPVLAAALPFVEAVHGAWDEVALDVIKARASDDWPEELFESQHERFEEIEGAFFAVNHDISQRLGADILRDPHAYFEMEPIADVPEKGVAHIALHGGTQRLRFQDGFPIGPNLFEQRDGHCNVVWFSRDRRLMTCETGYGGSRERRWIDYPSLTSGEWRRADDGAVSFRGTRAFWSAHGLSETFRADGTAEHMEFHRRGTALRQEFFFYPDGTPQLAIEAHPDGDVSTRRWPNGAVNTRSVAEPDDRARFLVCLAEDGTDLAPGGDGQLREVLPSDGERLAWREGALVAGYIDGLLVWMESRADGSDARETGRQAYDTGRGLPDEGLDPESGPELPSASSPDQVRGKL